MLRSEQLAALTATAHYVDELLNRVPNPDQPYVGSNAFAHKGGLHVAGVRADATTFEHIDPAPVGNRRELLDLRARRAAARSRTKAEERAWRSTTRRPSGSSSG